MIVRPLSRRVESRVGLVLGPDRVIGEWTGPQTWDNIPPSAKLYVQSLRALWSEYEAGRAMLRMWKGGANRPETVTGFSYRDKRVYCTRGILPDDPDEALGVLIEWAEWLRSNGANVGSLSGSSWSLWRSTLSRDVIESARHAPGDRLLLGGRQGMIERGTFEHMTLWDLRSAYACTLGEMALPRRWVRFPSCSIDEEYALIRAEVTVPKQAWGPLPISERGHVSFPTSSTFEGVWTAHELRAARDSGTEIDVREAWVGSGGRYVFREWARVMAHGRTDLSGPASGLIKISANSLWGSFATSGFASWVWKVGTKRYKARDGRKVWPLSRTLAGLVAAKVRARLFEESLATQPILACHTDGVVAFAGACMLPMGREPGQWRIVAETPLLSILHPQLLRYTDSDTGEYVYRASGMTGASAERIFARTAFMATRGQARSEEWEYRMILKSSAQTLREMQPR